MLRDFDDNQSIININLYITGIFMCFRLQQAADLTGQQDLDVPQGEPSNPRLVNAVLKICWRAAMISLLCKRAACVLVCLVFSERCGSGAADVGVWDGREGAGGLCQEASLRKVSCCVTI